MDLIEERNRLNKIASDSWYNRGANYETIKYCFKVFKDYFIKGSVLELGPAEGVMTEELVLEFSDITIVDGSDSFCKDLRRRYPNINIYNELFEEFHSERRFNNIILGHILEHVEDPVGILKRIKNLLSDNGIVLAAVPNANSIHRQAAIDLGLLKSIFDLNETDIHHGHRRVYNLENFGKDFREAGYKIIKEGGYWLKPLSNKQIESTWTKEMLLAFLKLGEKYPDISAEIYIIATI